MGARNGLVLMRRNIIIINEEWEAQEETKERKLGESDLFLFLLLFKGGSAKLVSCRWIELMLGMLFLNLSKYAKARDS